MIYFISYLLPGFHPAAAISAEIGGSIIFFAALTAGIYYRSDFDFFFYFPAAFAAEFGLIFILFLASGTDKHFVLRGFGE